ncbi:hypothetical protein jhhlp_002225 [Lomentospora prolificans]|uniref:Nucleoporin Nup159/Nup146 N-terminal domain-containing protein n=1 Tax=Lomentospora prolificans TaxID=41688 RepID=A0A2N3NDG3_9PEZI|nr:hypothetical protein jhhlp_002225 [Lomentospora prolificans]
MAFGFGNAAGAMTNDSLSAGGSGPELEVIQTDALGFLAIAGDAKVRLTAAWTSEPPSTASLLSIASRKGLVAAAGPEGVVLASTESVRKAFEGPKEGDTDIRGFEPQLKLPLPMRVSQIAFSADEAYLILSAESGGGLAVYEVQALLQGNTQTLFELSTNGSALRILLPNPTMEKAELCAVVDTNGNLYMANLKERALSNPLKDQVSSVSWSTKGKQLVAGLADGTIFQLTPEGEAKAQIPKPSDVGDYHVSSVTWLENHLFLAIHTSTNESPPSSVYHVITRRPPTTYTFQKLTDPVDPFGSDKMPHHSILRLKDFPPNLQDLLIVASTASPDIGLLSRSKSPLTTDKSAADITNVFTTTEMADDSRRATLPMTEDFQNAVPVGCAFDFSAKDTVYKPIPSEEIDESPGPVPGYWVLTHEGILCSWWVIYSESIKGGTTYPGMAAVDVAPSTPAQALSKPSPASGPAFGGSSALGAKPSPWGSPSPATPATSKPAAASAFGSNSFGSTPASSTPAFGKPSAFGASSTVGAKTSPWATAATATTSPAFGQSGFGALGAGKSVFGGSPSTPSTAPTSGGFAGFASKGGFGSLSGNAGGTSIFGSKPAENNSLLQSTDTKTAFPPPRASAETRGTGLFGSPSSTPFKLQSSFKPDPAAKDEGNEKPEKNTGGFFGGGLGSAFGSALQATTQSTPPPAIPPSKEEEMGAAEPEPPAPTPQPKSIFSIPSTTPTTTPAPTRFSFDTSTNKTGLFGSSGTAKPASAGFTGLFKTPEPAKGEENMLAAKTPPQIRVDNEDFPLPPESTSKAAYPLGDSSSSSGTAPEPERQSFGKVDEAPLPPDFLKTPNKPATKEAEDAPLPPDFLKVPGPSAKSAPAVAEDAPLPPDPTTKPLKAVSEKPKSGLFGTPEAAPLPPDFLPKSQQPRLPAVPSVPEPEEESDLSEDEADSESSAVDVAKDLSPSTTGLTHTPGMTPQSSFGGGLGGSGFMVSRPQQEPSRSLFGEVRSRGPIFPPPATSQSPRSPSPVRPPRPFGLEASRSVSAPGMASQILGASKKPQSSLGMSIVARGPFEEEAVLQQRKLRERREAEESQPLVDEEADEIQRILASEVEGTLEIDQFMAHTDVAPPARDSIPSQVEAVYRDINSMIDTLGLNSRSVKAFVKGHMEKLRPGPRTQEDLEIADDWVLCELEDLSEIIDGDLAEDLAECRVQDVEEKKNDCNELLRSMTKLRARQHDLALMLARFDPNQTEAHKHMPLSAEQAAQQNDLRREFAKLSKLLAEAEEAVTLLKTRIASVGGPSGKGPQPPTVDAVMRTITKMTTMVEKRSGDVDVLENQMRKLRASSVASREGTPMTPKRGSVALADGAFSGTPRNLRNSLSASPYKGPGTPTRKKLSGFSDEEKKELMERRAKKQAILQKLKTRVEEKGVTVWTMEEIE